MARRHALIRLAITGTAVLWGITIALSLTEIGSDRIHSTLQSAAFLAAATTLGGLGLRFHHSRVRRDITTVRNEIRAIRDDLAELRGDLNDAVRQAADELHQAVEEMGGYVSSDRQTLALVKTALAELRTVRAALERPGGWAA